MNETRVMPPGPWQGFFPGDWVRPRSNPGTWMPLIDVSEIFPGNRSVSRQGEYNLYDAPIGVELKIEDATKPPLVFDTEVEWERQGVSPSDVWFEEGRYHMFYQTSGPNAYCYAVSDDGYHWTRVELGEVEYKGSKKNNMHANHPEGGIFEDPSAPPEERFKAIGAGAGWYDPDTWEKLDEKEADQRWNAMHYEGNDYKGPKVVLRGWMVGWTSPDRFHGWKQIEEPLADYSVNGGINAGYDKTSGTYFAYMQPQGFAPEDPVGIGTGVQEVEMVRRANSFCRTKDFRHWPASKLIMHPDSQDPLDIAFYAHCYFPYPGRTDLHGMLTPVFHHMTGQMDAQIAFSRDGLIWYRPERRPIVTLGPPGSGEDCMIGASGIVELGDGRWGATYWAESQLHNIKKESVATLFPQKQPRKMGWALWEPHRFCGFEAQIEGRFTIPTIYRRNDELRLNYRCQPGGWLSVELMHMMPSMFYGDVDPLRGFTFEECDRLTGDAPDQVVTWQGRSDISGVGEIVAIRLKIFQAKIFAYQV